MLYSGFQNVKRRDSDVFRKLVFEELKKQKPIIGIIQKSYEVCPSFLKAILLLGYGLKTWFFAPHPGTSENLGIWEYENERKQIDYIKQIAVPLKMDLVHPSIRNLSWEKFKISGMNYRKVFQVLRILKMIGLRNDFLVSCRLSSTLFYYLWYTDQLRASCVKKIFLSSEANPCSMGALWASKKYGVKTFYIPHGHVADNPPGLQYDVCLLDGPALEDLFREAGGIQGEVIYKGIEGTTRSMLVKPRLHSVGFFLSLIYDEKIIAQIIGDAVKKLDPKEVLIRLHPNEILQRHTELQRPIPINAGVQFLQSESLIEDIKKCDLIICGNSSVHLTALKHGVPTVHIDEMDKLPKDTRHFIRDQIVYGSSGKMDNLTMDKISAFYSDGWITRFMKYDPHYQKSPSEIKDWLRGQIFSE